MDRNSDNRHITGTPAINAVADCQSSTERSASPWQVSVYQSSAFEPTSEALYVSSQSGLPSFSHGQLITENYNPLQQVYAAAHSSYERISPVNEYVPSPGPSSTTGASSSQYQTGKNIPMVSMPSNDMLPANLQAIMTANSSSGTLANTAFEKIHQIVTMGHSSELAEADTTQQASSTYPPQQGNSLQSTGINFSGSSIDQSPGTSHLSGMHSSNVQVVLQTMDNLANLHGRNGLTASDAAMVPAINSTSFINQSGVDSTEADIVQMLSVSQRFQPTSSSQQPEMAYVNQSEDEEANLNVIEVFSPDNDVKIRKSARLANSNAEAEPPVYKPKGYYDTNELWCDACQTTFSNGCSKHPMRTIVDKVVVSRAWASLPSPLQIFRLGNSQELGVFTKKAIPKHAQFGPFIAELVPSLAQVTVQKFVLKIDREDSGPCFFEASEENKCNWMMFVRPASKWSEQNLVAYQYGPDIYFSSTRTIEPKQEMKVWYAPHYAERHGFTAYTPKPEDLEALEQESDRWPCYECNKRFKSSAMLQKHLSVHDSQPSYSSTSRQDNHSKSGNKMEGAQMLTEEQMDTQVDVEGLGEDVKVPNDDVVTGNWKKKKTSIYLNKYKKYHRETIKKSIKSLYRRKGKESGGSDSWLCTHCDLTFDNPSLLNLHTLTHAAEDIGLGEIRMITGETTNSMETNQSLNTILPSLSVTEEQSNITGINELRCPDCDISFKTKQSLIQHASTHGKSRSRSTFVPKKPKCKQCWKSFTSEDHLQKHLLCHGDEKSKPLQCTFCVKRFMNNSALACHLKIHSDSKYYNCPMCKQGFDQVQVLKEHVKLHQDAMGYFTCPDCSKIFKQYRAIQKHVKAFHSGNQFPCPYCEKVLSRQDKLRLHMLKHSNHREFMCETCGRQFKRKDKMKEHIRRIHLNPDRIQKQSKTNGTGKKFEPKVLPTDYHRFIYKCHTCQLGFKRRGMLVNHLAKRHPDVKLESVPELNLPILKTQRDYFCQYCDKVYKSSSKRKVHILKNHPGSVLPKGNRRGPGSVPYEEGQNQPEALFSQQTGSITTVPHPCDFCHKQYASKAKLLQHQRKSHPKQAQPVQTNTRRSVNPTITTAYTLKLDSQLPEAQLADVQQPTHIVLAPIVEQVNGESIERFADVSEMIAEAGTAQAVVDAGNSSDLLSEAMAMNALTQPFANEGNDQGLQRQNVITTALNAANINQGAMLQPGQHTATIDLSHLLQLQQQTQQAGLNDQIESSPINVSLAEALSGTSTVVVTTDGQELRGQAALAALGINPNLSTR